MRPGSQKYWLHRLGSLLIKGAALVLVCMATALVGLYLLCQYKGHVVSAFVEEYLNEETGLYWRLKDVKPSLYPLPGVKFHSITVFEERRVTPGTEPLFSAASLIIEPDLLQLLNGGRIALRGIALDCPIFTLKSSPPLSADPASLAEQVSTPEGTSQQAAPPGPVAVVEESRPLEQLDTSTRPGSPAPYSTEITAALNTIKVYLQPRTRSRISKVTISQGRLAFLEPGGNTALEVTELQAKLRSSPGKESTISGTVALPDIGLLVDLDISFVLPSRAEPERIRLHLDTHARLTLPDTRPLVGNLGLTLQWMRAGNILRISDLIFAAEGDTILGELEFNPATVVLAGKLHFPSVSLPRWFFFARNLPPGLQERLHSLSGSMDVAVTPTSAHGTNVEARAGDLHVKGSLGADDFFNPVVNVDLSMDYADLDNIFPFLATSETGGPEPVEPEFSVPHMIPFPGPGGADAPDVWYDVKVHAQKVQAHALPAGPVRVTVLPVGQTKTRVGIEASSIAEGAIKGTLDIDKKIVTMRFDLDNLKIDLLPENKGSSVIFGGRATGVVDLTVPVRQTKWADDWGITFTGAIANHTITLTGQDGWGFKAAQAHLKGDGVVHTLRSKGLNLEGSWAVTSDSVSSTWHPAAKDTIESVLKGTLAWPPKKPVKPGSLPDKQDGKTESAGLYLVTGDLKTSGGLTLPLGETLIIPVKGTLHSPIEWKVQEGILHLKNYTFKGLDSTVTGNLTLDTSNPKTVVTSNPKYTLAPRVIFAAWNILPEAIQLPVIVTGTGHVKADHEKTLFSKLIFVADGAPMKGDVTITQPEARNPGRGDNRKETKPSGKNNMLWEVDLRAERLDLDNYLPPPKPEEKDLPPSKKPWDFSFLKGMDMRAKLFIEKAKFRGLNFNQTDAAFWLDKGKLVSTILTSDIYTGRATLQTRGTLDVKTSTIDLSKGNFMLKGISLGGAFADSLGSKNNYDGKADMVFDVTGRMACPADFPSALSGEWRIDVRDGIFPAFLGNDTAGLRNTFSRATLSGPMKKGVLSSEDFVMSGSMVDMKGKGWVDLGLRKLNMDLSVTLAGLPTLPVKFSGPFNKTEMNVGGSNIVVGTVEAAGSTVFNLFQGVLELPARAIEGVGALFHKKKKVEKSTYTPTAPPRERRRKPQ